MSPTLVELENELARDPKSRRFYELAREYQKYGRLDEAMALCERGLGVYPSQWQARILLAQLYIGKGRLEEARTMVERVLLPLPDNVPANHLAADVYRALGDGERALKHYRIVDLLDPGRAGVEERIAELSGQQEPAPEEAPSVEVSETVPAPPDAPPQAPPADGEHEHAAAEPPPALSAPILPPADGQSQAPPEPPAPEAPEPAPLFPEAAPSEGAHWPEVAAGEPEWAADTASFDQQLLTEAAGMDEAPHGEEAKAQEETGPLAAPEELPEGLASGAPAGREGEDSAEGLNTATLAELYEQQGFPEKAVEIYQRVLLRDPDNAAVRARISRLLQKMAGEMPEGPAVHQEDVERAVRRKRVVALQEWLRCVREGSHV